MNEYMTATENNYPIISNFTLSLLADSGWYEVDFSMEEPLMWGRHLGCGFLADCSGWTSLTTSAMGFCDANTSPQQIFCSNDRTAYGQCNIRMDFPVGAIPSYYQHYGSPTIGGQNDVADYCGYVGQKGNTIFCNLGGNDVQQVVDLVNILDTGQQFSTTSRCYFSTLLKLKSSIAENSYTDIFSGGELVARCYNTTCVDVDDLRVQIEGIWYQCIGQTKIEGYAGYVDCPPAEEICTGVQRDITWPRMTRVYPKSGPPGTIITITGENFDISNFNYTVLVESPCELIEVKDRETIIAKLPSVDAYIDIFDLYFFQSQKIVVVKDSRGYTCQQERAFTILVDLNIEYLNALANWMGRNPGWAALICACIVVPILLCCFCVFRILRKRKEYERLGPRIEPDDDLYVAYDDDTDINLH